MSTRRKNIFAVTAVVLSLFAGASAADAARSYPDGGTWDRGRNLWTGTVYSNYHHPSRVHGSTACNSRDCNRSPLVPRNQWSYASIKDTTGGNTTFYRFG